MLRRLKKSIGLTITLFCLMCLLIANLRSKEKLSKAGLQDSSHTFVEFSRSRPTAITRLNASSPRTQFKITGEVYDCLSLQTIRRYNSAVITKRSAPIRILDQSGEDASALKSSFIEIFDKQVWGGKETDIVDKMSENFKASGPGSAVLNTMGCMALLHTVIEKLKLHLNKNVISIADIPCGDLQWMSHFLKTRSDVKYTGIDIVPTLIARHTNTYKNNPNINFLNADVVHSPLNQSFDVIFSRQMMQHFRNSDIIRVLTHFSESGSKLMIATTYSDLARNSELGSTAGIRYRPVNLEKSPFNLVPPICSYREPSQTDNYLGLWELPLSTITP